MTDPVRQEEAARSRRFMRVFIVTALALLAGVVAINLVAFSLMLRPENATIVQLMAGWGRSYKPILHDRVQPELVVFGASIARDAFDPTEIEKLTGLRTFNHAVSGGHPYENRRFAQSAAENDRLRAVILNLDSFERRFAQVKFEYGFDESILNVTADGEKNGTVALHRLYATTLAGSATGYNLSLLWALAQAALGADREDFLPAYQRREGEKFTRIAAEVKSRLFPDNPPSDPIAAITMPTTIDRERLAELEIVLDTLCDRDIDVHVYTTPRHSGDCPLSVDTRLDGLALLKEKEGLCKSRYHFYDFQHPNPVTLEGILEPVAESEYFRPDGHPRPTMGTLMAAVMFERPFPAGTPDAVKADFGTDLMKEPRPLEWLGRHLARCDGQWTEADKAIVMAGQTRISATAQDNQPPVSAETDRQREAWLSERSVGE